MLDKNLTIIIEKYIYILGCYLRGPMNEHDILGLIPPETRSHYFKKPNILGLDSYKKPNTMISASDYV